MSMELGNGPRKRSKEWWEEISRAGADRAFMDTLAAQPSLAVIARPTVPLFIQHKGHAAPDLVASGVLLSIRDRVYVLTAAHVAERFGHSPFWIPVDDKIEPFPGESYRTPLPASGSHVDDKLDAAVFAVASGCGERLRSRCIGLEDIYPVERPYDVAYWVYGFPLKWSKRTGGQFRTEYRCMTIGGLSADVYERLKIDPNQHILMEAQKRVTSPWGVLPQRATRGMSGCGAWIVPTHHGANLPPRLSGIFIEKSARWPAFIASSIAIHLGQIWHFDEDLRGDIEAWSESESTKAFSDWLEKRGDAPSIPEENVPEWHRKKLGLR